ncbi:MAG: Phosphate regulon transcriptional regulatory protein PhoB (SphR) [Microgenomates group bacterium GW2011_GWA1_48_10]|uniref:Response regulatory domain-containing protein n=1 Tax=Candidatus Gottesmanbacteria bacterium RIFCSPHIGHO2_01_FULL_47_48 TaxID=1798381 RepID=A0A1F6A5H6_9BACT|nr:MAG: Phosphate regulon transcriptional regulatory protein PhoB (SphR) [Microgenomates group bacterium GW2011_GWA1_48_10]OGG19734.1 MAG: hypothetical protein A2721_01110 [Candidatus Gottesmanbacteria bacterium RIFCSPHIGHO2_01_FULL_47_48]
MEDQPTVLVVEDDKQLLNAITIKLSKEGISGIGVLTGEQGLKYLQESGPKLPNAIWLDYYLKDMNGLEFMQKIQTQPAWTEIPVIVVSNSASEDKVHSMLTIGAKKYILKAQSRLEDIIDQIKDLIAQSPVPSS